MRLAKDFSNINDFAYFVGGQIIPSVNEAPAVLMADNQTWIHGGYYAVQTGDKAVKWYPHDFEEMFEASDDLECLPEGWSAYADDADLSVYGNILAEFSCEEIDEAKTLAMLAELATFLTRKSKIAKLQASRVFDEISVALNGTSEKPASVTDAYTMLNLEKSLMGHRWGFSEFFSVDNDQRYVLVRHFTETTLKVRQFLNRQELTKP